MLQLLQEVRAAQVEMQKSLDEVAMQATHTTAALKEHTDHDDRMILEIRNAFPGGDTDGHMRYHRMMIERGELRNKIVRECLSKAAQVGFLASLGWVLFAIWVGIKTELLK